jgi:hypothetical protein
MGKFENLSLAFSFECALFRGKGILEVKDEAFHRKPEPR